MYFNENCPCPQCQQEKIRRMVEEQERWPCGRLKNDKNGLGVTNPFGEKL